MEVQAHTTPESRKALRTYLRNRRMTISVHQTITMQTLNDLEEALVLLRGFQKPTSSLMTEIQEYLEKRVPSPKAPLGPAIPGLLETE